MAGVACRVVPHLNLLRGTNWESKHWQSLLALVGLGRKSKDTVTLRDIFAATDAICANLDEIRSIDAQAQSEGIIRKALDELDLWGYQRMFSLLQATDSSGSAVRIHLACLRLCRAGSVMVQMGCSGSCHGAFRTPMQSCSAAMRPYLPPVVPDVAVTHTAVAHHGQFHLSHSQEIGL